MKIHADKALEILQLALKDIRTVTKEDLNDAITLGIEAILEHKKRRSRNHDAPFIFLPHEEPY